MARFTILAAITAAALTLGASVPVNAQAPVYSAAPVIKAKAGSVIIGETLWACADTGCTTARATSRPAIVCEQAARKLGRLDRFTANAAPFDAAALAACNTKAKREAAVASN